MIKQHIIHRMITDEILAFNKVGLKPNKIVMSSNILHHMCTWEHFHTFFIPAEQAEDMRARYYGLLFVEAVPQYSEDKTVTSGECFVCCAASSGKLKDIHV